MIAPFVLLWLIVAVSVMTEMSETSLSYISHNEIPHSEQKYKYNMSKNTTKKEKENTA